jgi:presenilin-like A22 family membrane protease
MPRIEKKTIDKEKIKAAVKPLLGEAVFFILIFVLGIFAALKMKILLIQEEIELPSLGPVDFLAFFIFATLIILFIVYLPKVKRIKGFIYKFLFIFSAIYGGLMVLSLLFRDVIAIAAIVLMFFWWFKHNSILSHNLLITLAMAGIGAVFGLSFKPEAVILLLLILSFYDFIAVYKTKHMVRMASSMIEAGAIMGLIIPQKISGLKVKTKEIKPGENFIILGGGDIIFPLILAVSVLPYGLLSTAIVSLFAFLGIVLSFSIFALQKERKPIPALPPIALMSILGYLITTLL